MAAELTPELGRGLHEVAVGLLLSDRLDVAVAIELAEALVAGGRVEPATVAAASSSRGSSRADAEPLVREMLSAYGIAVPEAATDVDAYRAAAVAFGWWSLPVADFARAFHRRLPRLDEQSPLDVRILALLDEREHLPWVLGPERDRVERRLRATVRSAFPTSGG